MRNAVASPRPVRPAVDTATPFRWRRRRGEWDGARAPGGENTNQIQGAVDMKALGFLIRVVGLGVAAALAFVQQPATAGGREMGGRHQKAGGGKPQEKSRAEGRPPPAPPAHGGHRGNL